MIHFREMIQGVRFVWNAKASIATQLMVFGLSVALCFTAPLTARADVSRPKDDGHFLHVFLTGTISEADASQFERLSPMFEHKTPHIRLNGMGGDVVAAMKIGRIVKKYDGLTRIDGDNKCFSSCALIFIAGVVRLI